MRTQVALLLALLAAPAMSAASHLMFIGTYTPKDGASQGIYAVRLDAATGALAAPVVAAVIPNPSFLAWHPSQPVLYAIGEGPGPDGKTSGGAKAFMFDQAAGRLAPLDARGAGGGSTTHLAADATGRMLLTVSYGGGQVAAFPIEADGRLRARTAWHTPAGPPGPNTRRQDKPHPHSVTLSPDNRHAYVCDLGLDKILCYRLGPAAATLAPAGEFSAPAGAGPRHGKFSADGRFLYVINELGNSITTYACDPATGALTASPTVSTLPADFTGASTCAEIRLHPNGRFLYGSNRGHDSIAVFALRPDGGPELAQIIPSGGKHPRNFNLSPDGAWLVCANRDSDNLVSFKVDPATGRLSPTGSAIALPQGVCVLFAP